MCSLRQADIASVVVFVDAEPRVFGETYMDKVGVLRRTHRIPPLYERERCLSRSDIFNLIVIVASSEFLISLKWFEVNSLKFRDTNEIL